MYQLHYQYIEKIYRGLDIDILHRYICRYIDDVIYIFVYYTVNKQAWLDILSKIPVQFSLGSSFHSDRNDFI